MNPLPIISIIALLAFAGFLAGTESALASISRVVIEELERKRGGALLKKVFFDQARYLNVVLLVRKTCELTATVLLAVILLREYSSAQAMALTVAIMVIVSYVMVGVGPRTLGKQKPNNWALAGATVAYFLAFILAPLTKLLIAIGNAITPGKGFRSGPFANEAELRDLVDQAHERGLVESDEHEMIHSVFELGDTLVRELMVPRTDMVWVEKDKTLRQGLSLALRSGFSRIPVVGENIDNIIGITYVKDLARRALDHHEAETTERVEQHLRPATFVPEIKIAAELLKEMQRDQIHLASVVDEYGALQGLVTLEDILEEIVGDIVDEHDIAIQGVRPQPDGSVNVDGAVPIRDLNRAMDWDLPDEEAVTIAGLVIHEAQAIPDPGQRFAFHGYRFQILRKHRNQILAIRITPEAASDKD